MTRENISPAMRRLREQQQRQWIAGDTCWDWLLTSLTHVVSVEGHIVALANGERLHRVNMRGADYQP